MMTMTMMLVMVNYDGGDGGGFAGVDDDKSPSTAGG